MKRAVFLVVLALLTSRPLFAQSTTEGAIGGLVVDQSKGVLPGATVNARNTATNSTASTTTDESGHFTVIRLQPGTYAVDVTLAGFATSTTRIPGCTCVHVPSGFVGVNTGTTPGPGSASPHEFDPSLRLPT